MGDDLKQLEATWDELAKIFNNWEGIRPRISWLTTGLSERAGYKRLRVLEDGKQAAKFYDITKDLKTRQLRYLLKRAELNFEQAYNAGRISMVINGSAVIGFVVILNQIFPGAIQSFFKFLFLSLNNPTSTLDVIGSVISLSSFLMGIITLIVVLSYSYGGTAQARDLKHLLELSLARREYYEGKRHHEDSGSENILKESFLTDI